MELLVVTVSPRTLILGKVLALSVAVLVQMGLIIGGLFVRSKNQMVLDIVIILNIILENSR